MRYCPVPQVEISASGEKIELTTNIPEGYFDSFAGEVIEFFKHLNKELRCARSFDY